MMTTKAAYFYDLKVISDDKKNVENLKLIDLILPGGFFQVTKYDEKGKPKTFPLTLNISPLCTTENDIMSSMKEQIGNYRISCKICKGNGKKVKKGNTVI